MADIILDTNILADLLAQYYKDNVHERGYFKVKGRLHKNLVREINRILKWHMVGYSSSYPGLVVASSFAFVEIARKFDEISARHFTVEQFAAFIDQTPEWFVIAAVDSALFPFLSSLPREISLPNGDIKPIEWADAIHIATAVSRDEPWLLASSDTSIREVKLLKNKII